MLQAKLTKGLLFRDAIMNPVMNMAQLQNIQLRIMITLGLWKYKTIYA